MAKNIKTGDLVSVAYGMGAKHSGKRGIVVSQNPWGSTVLIEGTLDQVFFKDFDLMFLDASHNDEGPVNGAE